MSKKKEAVELVSEEGFIEVESGNARFTGRIQSKNR